MAHARRSVPFVSSFPAERLETRIAPAIVFFTGTDAKLNGVTVNNPALATDFGAGLALVIGPGNSLVIDVDGDGKFVPAKDHVIATTKAGRGVFFFTDLNNDLVFSSDELTGLLVSNGFSGGVTGAIEGSVVTGLSASGTPRLQDGRSDIAGLTVGGKITGSILADGSVKNVTVQNLGFEGSPSVAEILTGNVADESEYSLNGGSKVLSFSSDEHPLVDVSGITLARGTSRIAAGDGPGGGNISKITIAEQTSDLSIAAGSATPFSGGAGGSISGVDIKKANDLTNYYFVAGDGAVGVERNGAGGSIKGVTIDAEGAVIGEVLISAGSGGNPSDVDDETFETAASGGAGGNISAVNVKAMVAVGVALRAGDGGDGGYIYHEAVVETREKQVKRRDEYGEIYYETVYYDVVLQKAVERGGAGGAGGSISGTTIAAINASVAMVAGGGGSAYTKPAGNGGSITKTNLDGVATTIAEGGLAGAGVKGGAGGSVSQFSVTNLFENADVFLGAQQGGFGLKGGAAGVISNVAIKSTYAISEIGLVAGDGANGYYEDEDNSPYGARPGGTGGAVKNVLVDVYSAESFSVLAGKGGQGGRTEIYVYGADYVTVGGAGGAGGSVSKVTFKEIAGEADTIIYAGNGGRGRVDKSGGAGGKISKVTLEKIGELNLKAGNGGEADEFGNGSAGGSISNLSVVGGTSGLQMTVAAGDGTAGVGGGSGGVGGSVSKIAKFDNKGGTVEIRAGNGGDGSSLYIEPLYETVTKLVRMRDEYGGVYYDYVEVDVKVRNAIYKAGGGGAGGSISGVALQAMEDSISDFHLAAGNGGSGKSISAEVEKKIRYRDEYGEISYDYVSVIVTKASKASGVGGSVKGVTLNALAGSDIDLIAAAGEGGSGEGVAKGAAGGKISGVVVKAKGTIGSIDLEAGDGGNAGEENEKARGAAGGGISKILLEVLGDFTGMASVIGGNGGEGAFGLGVGGSLSGIKFTGADIIPVELIPGDGSPPGTVKGVSPL